MPHEHLTEPTLPESRRPVLITGATGYVGGRLVQTAFFVPTGFLGWLYWYGLYPFHARIFSDLVNALARDALSPGEEVA